jgi:aerobic carbon-monoxide dehydrogenase small subunit
MKSLTLELNGASVTSDVEPRTTLADFLRDRCRLTATHLGCEHGACGACTVVVDGRVTRSCLRLAVMCDGHSVQTLEGLEDDPIVEVLRRQFHECHGLQCGFCTPGMLTTAHALLSEEPDADEARIRSVLSGNLCRCTGYIPIIDAVLEARAAYRKGDNK